MLHVRLHLKPGCFVFSTPDMFAMGRAVRKSAAVEMLRNPYVSFPKEAQDAWWIHAFAGDMSKLPGFMPWRLEWVGFERFDNYSRFLPIDRIMERAMQGAKHHG